jgi:hypothetical protein
MPKYGPGVNSPTFLALAPGTQFESITTKDPSCKNWWKEWLKRTLKSNVDISTVTNDKILELLKEDLDGNDIKALIYKILKEKKLNEVQMETLSNAIKMIELNIDKKAVLALIMLSIKEKI